MARGIALIFGSWLWTVAYGGLGGSGPSAHPRVSPLKIPAPSRLLVIAPHPDDEVIGAGGLIRRVRARGGTARVVYLTDGEAYTAGVEAEERRADPSASDYRDYGRRRRREARAALKRLGVDEEALTFLGFPNNGLAQLMSVYWSEQRDAFTSPYTRRDRPRPSQMVVPATRYRGEDLTQELAEIIGDFQPTIIVVPRREDQHVDHCAAWYFTGDALGDVRRVRRAFRTDVMTYIVHYNSWPFEQSSPLLAPPPDLPAGPSGWLDVRLMPEEARTKRDALQMFESQMKAMGWFLQGFARSNELFSRPPAAHVVLPMAHNPCSRLAEKTMSMAR
jgi:LmbE family N-acetylglucosaminyl deacetylase